jgi:hypothetical protein
VAQAISLIGAVSRQLSTGPHMVRVRLVRPGEEAILFSRARRFSDHVLITPHAPVFAPQTEVAEVDGELPNRELRSLMRQLALAVTTQGGLDRMRYLTATEPPPTLRQPEPPQPGA